MATTLQDMVRQSGISTDQIRAALVRLQGSRTRGKKVLPPAIEASKGRIALAYLAQSERDFAFHLLRLVKPVEQLSVPAQTSGRKDAEQDLAVERAAQNAVSIVTGGPGRGKTHVVNRIIAMYDAAGLCSFDATGLAAPTGKAAIRMRELCGGRAASTIHRLLKFHPEAGFRYDTTVEPEFSPTGMWLRGGPVPFQVVIIDETSMVDIELGAALVRGIETGTRLVFVGDVDQLPSVGAGRVLYDLIQSGVIPVTRLLTIHRTAADSGIPYVADDINNGRAPTFEGRAGCSFVEADEVDEVIAEVLSQVRDALARGVAARDIQVLAPQKERGAGVEALNVALKAALNPSDFTAVTIGSKYQVHVGDKVIHMHNNYQLAEEGRSEGTFNGEIGFVTQAAPGGIPEASLGNAIRSDACGGKTPAVIVVDFGDRQVAYTKTEAMDLALAYCVTGHKFQGSQARVIIVVCHEAHAFTLTRSWTYTAATRSSEQLIFVGQLSALAKAVRNTRGTERGTDVQALLRAA